MNDMTTASPTQSMLGLASFYFEKASEHSLKKKKFFLSKAMDTLEDAQPNTLEIARNYYLRWATVLNNDPTCSQERNECLRQCKCILDSLPMEAYLEDPARVDDSFDAVEVGRFCRDLGEACFQAGNLADARSFLESSIKLFDRHSNQTESLVQEQSCCHCRLAQIMLQQEDWKDAIDQFKFAVLTAHYRTVELATLFHDIVSADFDQVELDQKVKRICRLTEILMSCSIPGSNEPLDLGRLHYMLGIACFKLDRLDHFHLEQAIQIFEAQTPESSDSWGSHLVMAQIMVKRKAFDEAITHFQRAAEIAKSTESLSALATTYRDMGSAFRGQGDYDQAVTVTLKAIEIQERHRGPFHAMKLTQSYKQLGLVYQDMGLESHNQGEYDRAIDFIEKAIEIQAHASDTLSLTQSYKLLGLVFESRGECFRAVMCYRKVIEYSEGRVEFAIYQRLGLASAFAASSKN